MSPTILPAGPNARFRFGASQSGGSRCELNAVRAQLREKQNALGNIMSAIEAGADFKTLADRINTLEQDKAAVEERINRLELERADREKQSLSTEVVAETYCDFPFIFNRLKETGDLHGLRDLLRCYIAAIDVHQEEDGPCSAHMEIMLFEEETPGWEATAHQKNARRSAVSRLELRACESAPRVILYANTGSLSWEPFISTTYVDLRKSSSSPGTPFQLFRSPNANKRRRVLMVCSEPGTTSLFSIQAR